MLSPGCCGPRGRGRLRRGLIRVRRQIGMLEAQAEIKTQVEEELGRRRREMHLREQLKAIQGKAYAGTGSPPTPIVMGGSPACIQAKGLPVIEGRSPTNDRQLVVSPTDEWDVPEEPDSGRVSVDAATGVGGPGRCNEAGGSMGLRMQDGRGDRQGTSEV